MIHRLRRRHRRLWLVLAVALPLLYVLALVARQRAPIVPALPDALRDDTAAAGEAAP
jgi:hypothetical protein